MGFPLIQLTLGPIKSGRSVLLRYSFAIFYLAGKGWDCLWREKNVGSSFRDSRNQGLSWHCVRAVLNY